MKDLVEYIAKALVDAHGGHISATSAGSSTGATFTIGLPLLLVPLRTPSR